VAIDSGPLVAVGCGDSRSDIASSFPGFSNGSSGGGGHYLLDTTALANGSHQIGWYVVGNCGRADGIGSRFFTILNGAGDPPSRWSIRECGVAIALVGSCKRAARVAAAKTRVLD
jgi:hypothetical protein